VRKPLAPPKISDLLHETLGANPQPEVLENVFRTASSPAPDGKYRHWDTLRHLEPPGTLTVREWWMAVKLARLSLYRRVPLLDSQGDHFQYALPDIVYAMLHDIDKRASGMIGASDQVTNPQTRDTYLVRSLMEEAITSSQLEGAATTRRVAKEMLQTGRQPRTRSEQMIANNYRAMRHISERSKVPLSRSLVEEFHTILTLRTLDEGSVGRFRTASDNIVVEDGTGVVLHVPPPADQLPQRMAAMCEFANHSDPKAFTHPVIKAVLLHFWLAYDHPFVDGNGRTARALFYWSLARDEYWLFEFISISRILRAAPSKYARAFLYTESDDNDLTYFLLNQLGVIIRAIDDLYRFLARKARELSETRGILDHSGPLKGVFNYRQIAIIQHALRHPNYTYSIRSHRESHGVSYQTARTDLLVLAKLGILDPGKLGRSFVFGAPHDLQLRLEKLKHRRNSGVKDTKKK
jgi:Fic family protein